VCVFENILAFVKLMLKRYLFFFSLFVAVRRFFGRPLLSFVLQKGQDLFWGGKKFREKFFTSLSSLFTHFT